AVHAERRRVDEQTGVRQQFSHRLPPVRRSSAAEVMAQFLGAPNCPVHDAYIAEATRLQRVNDRPRGTSGAKHRGNAAPIPAGRPLVEIGGKAVSIGVAAAKSAILEPERIGRTDSLGRLVLLFQ